MCFYILLFCTGELECCILAAGFYFLLLFVLLSLGHFCIYLDIHVYESFFYFDLG